MKYLRFKLTTKHPFIQFERLNVWDGQHIKRIRDLPCLLFPKYYIHPFTHVMMQGRGKMSVIFLHPMNHVINNGKYVLLLTAVDVKKGKRVK